MHTSTFLIKYTRTHGDSYCNVTLKNINYRIKYNCHQSQNKVEIKTNKRIVHVKNIRCSYFLLFLCLQYATPNTTSILLSLVKLCKNRVLMKGFGFSFKQNLGIFVSKWTMYFNLSSLILTAMQSFIKVWMEIYICITKYTIYRLY